MSTNGFAYEYAPRVTKSIIKGPKVQGFETDFAHFDDSDTLIFTLNGSLYISFDNGENWQPVDAFKEEKLRSVSADRFHKGRAFVTSEGGKIHVTEDQGRSWRELHVPKAPQKDSPYFASWKKLPDLGPDEHVICSTVKTHPTNRRLFLVYLDIRYGSTLLTRQFVYVSDDAGKIFRRIRPPVNYCDDMVISEWYRCLFAVSSEESTLENNGIYYIHRASYAKRSSTTQDLRLEQEEEQEERTKNILFYTADFGRTTKFFDELKDSSVENIFIFPSSVLLLTTEGKQGENNKLWISKGKVFEPLHLPGEVVSLEYVWYSSDDAQRQLLFAARLSRDHNAPFCLLIFDPLNLNLSFQGPTPWSRSNFEYFRQLGNLKGTFLGETEWRADSDNPSIGYPVTIASFDAGKSWTKLRLKPLRDHSHLFECDADDECFVVVSPARCQCCPPYVSQNEPTAGILIIVGAIEKKENRENTNTADMTFISRDGGLSWEVAFEFPVYAVCLDFGNIIVAVPWEYSKIFRKFYFSLDQGRTWNDYPLHKPISGCIFRIYGSGLKVLINITRTKEGFTDYVFYSLDFSNIFGGAACTEDDLERWHLYDGKCIDGVRYSFDRRKPDAKCLVRKTFGELELHEERDEP